MKPHFPQGQPTVRNRASVAHSQLSVTFLSKEQLDAFVAALLKYESYPSFTVETNVGDSVKPNEYNVTLHDIAWGHNLVAIAKLVEKFDYNSGN